MNAVFKRSAAFLMSISVASGLFAACSEDPKVSKETSETAVTTEAGVQTEKAESEPTVETSAAETEAKIVNGFRSLDVKTPEDEEGAAPNVLIYSFNNEFPSLVDKYSDVDVKAEVFKDSRDYKEKLSKALESENGPDIFVCDADYAREYLDSDYSLPVNELGIDYNELDKMYNYTLQFACDGDNVIKGLAWQACPSGVLYNRELMQQYFGVSEPADVEPYFSSWEKFLETARKVNSESQGKVKAISGVDDIWRAYLNTRSSGWIENGKLNIDPVMKDYFTFGKTLRDEGLTFGTKQFDASWKSNAENDLCLSYFGPLWLGRVSLGLSDENSPGNGKWGMVKGPSSSYWGGSWIMVNKKSKLKAKCAQIIRDLTLNEENLRAIADSGDFVNSVTIMTDKSDDEDYSVKWLGGQNPIGILLDIASGINYSTVGRNDLVINDAFTSVAQAYFDGSYADIDEALEVFRIHLEEIGVI